MKNPTEVGQAGTKDPKATPAPTQTEGSATMPEIKPEVIAQALKTRELWGDIKVPTQHGELPLSEVVSGYLRQQDATKKWQEAAEMKREAEALKRELEQIKKQMQQDPLKQLVEVYQQSVAPPPPPDPLETLGDDEYTRVLRSTFLAQEQKIARLERALNEAVQKTTKTAEEIRQEVEKRIQVEEAWREFERQVDDARSKYPNVFTAKVVTDPATGQKKVDYGDNPYLTIAALQISNSHEPDPRLNNRAGINVPLAEIVAALWGDLENKVLSTIEQKRQQEEAMRRATTTIPAGMPPPVGFSLTEEIKNMPQNTPEEILVKAQKIREWIESQIPKSEG